MSVQDKIKLDEIVPLEATYDSTEEMIEIDMLDLENTVYIYSANKYNPALQTNDTISPHYFVNGEPYSSTQFDDSFHCTAPIEVKPSTTYTIGLVPANNNIVKPWNNAGYGLFFYDEDETYISGTTNNTFTTPSNCQYIRFNYAMSNVGGLSGVNERCVLVLGETLPEVYIPYEKKSLTEQSQELRDMIASQSGNLIHYNVDSNNVVTLIAKYNTTYDIVYTLKCHGGNNLFDFYSIYFTPSIDNLPASTTTNADIAFISSSGDWHAPFVMAAKSNIDGDDINGETFTGGNHQYNNNSSGSTSTARMTSLTFYADNKPATGTGYCSRFSMYWTNLVQGYNTKRSDGTGREILQENHRLIFDGIKFESYVDLIPLEDINIQTWYGFQWVTTPYSYIQYIGGTNRAIYDISTATNSGNATCCHSRSYNNNHELQIDIDANYDLGDHKFYSEGNEGMFTTTYGKAYCKILSYDDLNKDAIYSLHGTYTFCEHRG